MGAGGLGEESERRLAELRERGCEVIGPTPAEDTAATSAAPAEADSPGEAGWTVVVHCPQPDGETRTITGHGASAEQAAASALGQAAPAE